MKASSYKSHPKNRKEFDLYWLAYHFLRVERGHPEKDQLLYYSIDHEVPEHEKIKRYLELGWEMFNGN